jgi:hypothetical protein
MKLAIITGDLIGSSNYSSKQREEAIHTLKYTLNEEQGQSIGLRYEMYRGDSIQIEVEKVERALALAILLRSALMKLPANANSSKPYADIRLSIGIGEAEHRKESIVESDGEVYRFSGRTFDMMEKKGQHIVIRTSDEDFNQEYDVQCTMLEYIMERWSTSSAEVVYWSLKGLKDIEIAKKLDVSQPAISARKKVAGWEAIDKMIKWYENKILKTI